MERSPLVSPEGSPAPAECAPARGGHTDKRRQKHGVLAPSMVFHGVCIALYIALGPTAVSRALVMRPGLQVVAASERLWCKWALIDSRAHATPFKVVVQVLRGTEHRHNCPETVRLELRVSGGRVEGFISVSGVH